MAFNKKRWNQSNFDEKLGTNDAYRRMGDMGMKLTGVYIGNSTRNAGGTQVISDVGFQPSIVIFLSADDTQANMNHSIGFDNVTARGVMYQFDNGTQASSGLTWCIAIRRGVGNALTAVLTSLDTNGFTLTWALVGAVTVDFTYICLP